MLPPETFHETFERYYRVTKGERRRKVGAELGAAALSAGFAGVGLALAQRGYHDYGEGIAAYFTCWTYIFTEDAKYRMLKTIYEKATTIS